MFLSDLLNWVASVGFVLGVIGLILFIPMISLAIYFFARSKSPEQKEEAAKRKFKKRGIWLMFLPFVLIFSSLLIYIMAGFLRTMLEG
jgi:4-hydroxybenzoate polyprenyltransferase